MKKTTFLNRILFPGIAILVMNTFLVAGPLGIVVSSDTGSNTSELRYYDNVATFLGDTVNVSGVFTSISSGDFDNDGFGEIVAARHVSSADNDLYYYEFLAGNLYFDTRNLSGRYSSVASGNFDLDAEDEVVVARHTGTGVVGDLFDSEIIIYQPNQTTPYRDSTNDQGRFVAVTTGNLDSDSQDEIVVVKLHEDGLNTQVESEFWIADAEFTTANGDPRNLLVKDLTPNRSFDLTDAAIGSFDETGTTANIAITSDRRPGTSRAELFTGDTDAETVTYAFDQVPLRSEGMVGIATANLDGDNLDDMAIILNGTGYATLEIYHGDGISKSPTSVEYLLKGNSQAIAVDTGDLDSDGFDEIVVLYDLLNGQSQIVTYKVDQDFELNILSEGLAYTGIGTDVAVVVPEPSAATLLFIGLSGLVVCSRRRRK